MKKLFTILLFTTLVSPSLAIAAVWRIEAWPPTREKSTFVIQLEADQAVNALTGRLIAPAGATWGAVNASRSIVSLWLKPPVVTGQALDFAGIIPGGWQGSAGEILRVELLGPENTRRLIFDRELTAVHLNTPEGAPDEVTYEVVVLDGLPVEMTEPSLGSVDDYPPEPFSVSVTSDPDVFDGRLFAVFSASDKGSGLSHYEIAESRWPVLPFKRLPWRRAESSPYLLADQSGKAAVYVRAIDGAGNERLAVFSPTVGFWQYGRPGLWFILIAFAVWAAIFIRRRFCCGAQIK